MILAGGGVLRAPDLDAISSGSPSSSGSRSIAGWRRGDVISNDHPLYLGMAGYGSPAVVRERLERGRRDPRPRLPAVGDHVVRLPDPGRGPGLDARRRRAARAPGRGLPRPDAHDPGRRPGVPPGGRRPPPGGRPRRGVRRCPATRPTQPIAPPGRPRPRPTARPWSGPGVHPAHVDRGTPAGAPRRRDRRDRCRQLRPVGRPPLPVPAAGHVPRPDVRARWAMRLPAAIAAASSIATGPVVAFAGDGGFAMTMAELETAVREKAQGRSRSSSTTSATARSGCTRTRRGGEAGRSRPISARSTSPRSPGPAERAGIRVETDAAFEQAVRQAIANDRADGHPGRRSTAAGCARRPFAPGWLTRAMRLTYHLDAGRLRGRPPIRPRRSAPPSPRARGLHPLHRRAPRRWSPPRTATTATIRAPSSS